MGFVTVDFSRASNDMWSHDSANPITAVDEHPCGTKKQKSSVITH